MNIKGKNTELIKENSTGDEELIHETRGGTRAGAGRKRKYEDPVSFTFTIERKKKAELKQAYGKTINSLFDEWVDKLNFEIKKI